MKALRRLTAVALAMTVVLVVGVMTVSAQAPTGTQIAYLDNQAHTLGPNSSQLFRFDYAIKDDGSRPLTTIVLPNGNKNGLGFEVWTADQLHGMATTAADALANKATNSPIGRGTAQTINCDTGVIDGSGACQSADLIWAGTFGSSGPYYVKVINNSNSENKFQLAINGSGVSLGQQQQTAAVAPSAPAAAPALVAAGADSTSAVSLDSKSHDLAAGTATWYKFDYALKDNTTRPVVTLRMPNGNASGLAFEVWTADQLHGIANNAADARADNSHNQPIGRGTAQTINCDTGVVDGSGACKSADLIWSGTFGTAGTYFVKVINSNNSSSNYQLMMSQQ